MIHRSGIVKGERVYENPLSGKLPETATALRFSISSHGSWLPGCYDSERAARYAFGISDDVLSALQQKVNADNEDPDRRVITFEMLQAARRKAPL